MPKEVETESGELCQLPFMFADKLFYACTSIDNKLQCITETSGMLSMCMGPYTGINPEASPAENPEENPEVSAIQAVDAVGATLQRPEDRRRGKRGMRAGPAIGITFAVLAALAMLGLIAFLFVVRRRKQIRKRVENTVRPDVRKPCFIASLTASSTASEDLAVSYNWVEIVLLLGGPSSQQQCAANKWTSSTHRGCLAPWLHTANQVF
jgi:hypothetical protein